MSNSELKGEFISRMAQAFPSPIGETEGLGIIPVPFIDVNNVAGGVAGNSAIGGSAVGVGKGKSTLGLLPLENINSVKGATGSTAKSKGLVGTLPFEKLKTVTGAAGSAGKKKASVSLLPGTTVAPTSSAKHFILGKSLIGATAILPGMAAFAGPTGLLPSVTAITAGFGAGVLMPLFLFGTLIAATSHKDKKPRKAKASPTGGNTNSREQSYKKQQPEKKTTPFNYTGYSVAAKSASYTKEKPISQRSKAANIDMINPYKSSKSGGEIPQHVGFDRRFALRIKVPTKTLLVRGLLSNGEAFQSYAKNVSMHGINFRAPYLPIADIKQLVFLNKNKTLEVVEYQLHRQTSSEAVAILTSFVNGPDDWMQWIERITRMDQKF
ncbi:MAG: hypothetical protein HQL71_15770 [Magnetococcales bacterium]|nr:hypothetical protein [Magnetococcales bacterium]